MATATNSQILLGLYAAIYVRSPDKAGYDFWTAGFTAGTLTPGGAATAFSARTEWATAYPSTMTTAAYVDKIYLNVLGIAGDAGGRAFWTANIDKAAYTREVFVAEFIKATIEYDSAADTTSTAAQKASAVQAQTAINSKVSFSEAWIASPAASNPALTGVDSASNYVAANDKSVALLAGVSDAATLATQTPKITAAASAGSTLTLTTANDTFSTQFTTSNETVTGITGTLNSGDIILDATATDADVLTVAGVAGTGTLVKPNITKIETINISGSTSTGIDLTTVSGTKVLNLSNTTASTAASATVTNAKLGAADSIVAGTNVGVLNVAAASTGTGGDLVVNAGTATTVTLTGGATAGVVDNFALTTTGDVTIKAGSSMAIEAVRITANPVAAPAGTGTATTATKAPVITLDSGNQLLTYTPAVAPTVGTLGSPATGGMIEMLGASDVELKADIAALSGRTINRGAGKLTVTLSQAATATADYDMKGISVDTVVNLTSDTNVSTFKLNVNDKAVIGTTVNQTALKIGAAEVTLSNAAPTQGAVTSDNLKVLNIVSAAPATAAVDATYASIDLAGAANATATPAVVAGANFAGTKLIFTGGAAAAGTTAAGPQDIKVTKGVVETVDASKLIGSLDYTAAKSGAANEKLTFTGTAGADKLAIAADLAVLKSTINATLGDGDDTVSLPGGVSPAGVFGLAGSVFSVDGGVGTDTLVLADGADLKALVSADAVPVSTLTLTNVENVTFDGTVTFAAPQLKSLAAVTIKGGAGTADILTVVGDGVSTAIDMSTLKLDSSIERVVITGGSKASTLTGSALKNTMTGGTSADSIKGAVGTDILSGGLGLDTLTGGDGADTFMFIAGDAGVAPSSSAFDTVTDFVRGVDKLSFTGASNVASTSVVPVASSGKAGINPNSVATFDTSDTTLAQQVNAVANSLATSGVGVSAVWGNGLDSYVFIKGGVATVGATTAVAPAATDVLVKLTNITFNANSDTLSTFMSGVTAVVVTSTPGNDYLIGTSSPDGFNGQAGNDTILGLAGSDTLNGDDGNDDLDAGTSTAANNDKMTGGAGNDTFRISTGVGAENVGITDLGGTVGGEADVLVVGSGLTLAGTITVPAVAGWIAGAATTIGSDVTLTPTAAGTVINLANVSAPGTGKWTVTGANKVTFTGSSVADNIAGSSGDDTINGGSGNDTIASSNGADSITGGAGDDSITGGTGIDTIVFSAAATNGNDTITSFTVGTAKDVLKVTGVATLVGSGATGAIAAANAIFVGAKTGAKGDTAVSKLIVIDDTDKADAAWSNVTTKIGGALTIAADTTAGNANTVVLLNNGTDTRVYLFSDDATSNATVEATELTLLGTVTAAATSANWVEASFVIV